MSIYNLFSGYQESFYRIFPHNILFEWKPPWYLSTNTRVNFNLNCYFTVPGARLLAKMFIRPASEANWFDPARLEGKLLISNSRVLTDLQNNLCTSSYNLFKNTFNTCSMADHCIAAPVSDHHSNDVWNKFNFYTLCFTLLTSEENLPS